MNRIALEPVTGKMLLNDISGQTFGKLTAIRLAGKVTYKKGMALYFDCRCACGAEVTMQRSNLIFGKKTSCGCDKRDIGRTAPPGSWGHPLYKVWTHMIDRCQNPKNKSFADYGGRGIRVCERWLTGEAGETGFACFTTDMGPRPTPAHMIERMDNEKSYEPSNCAWADRKQQNSNKRNNIQVTIGQQTLTVAEWARRRGVNEFTIYQRIRKGMDPVEAVMRPVR